MFNYYPAWQRVEAPTAEDLRKALEMIPGIQQELDRQIFGALYSGHLVSSQDLIGKQKNTLTLEEFFKLMVETRQRLEVHYVVSGWANLADDETLVIKGGFVRGDPGPLFVVSTGGRETFEAEIKAHGLIPVELFKKDKDVSDENPQ